MKIGPFVGSALVAGVLIKLPWTLIPAAVFILFWWLTRRLKGSRD